LIGEFLVIAGIKGTTSHIELVQPLGSNELLDGIKVQMKELLYLVNRPYWKL
jgi:hypothetical protein